MTAEEAEIREDVMAGTALLFSHPAIILFDSGASTSFVSRRFVSYYDIPVDKLEVPLRVGTGGGIIIVDFVIRDCPFVIGGWECVSIFVYLI